MFYGRSVIKSLYYFFKIITPLWVIPLLFTDLVLPGLIMFLRLLETEETGIEIQRAIFFFIPIFTVFASVFVSEVFFCEKTGEAFFFYTSKKRFAISFSVFLVFLLNSVIVMCASKNGIKDLGGLIIKLVCVCFFFYALAMIVLRFAKTAAMAMMVLVVYSLLNTFVGSQYIFLLYEEFAPLTVLLFFIKYFPLLIAAVVMLCIAFHKSRAR